MEVRLLGELEVDVDGSAVDIRGAKARTLVAVLALHRGEPVAPDRLIDILWGEEPPGNPTNALQALVATLRRTVGSAAVVTTDAGYALQVGPDELDIGRFERLVTQGRRSLDEGDAAAASDTLRTATSLCRDEPLVEFTYAEFASGERARLQELVLVALEGRIEADLALGRHAELVAELESLCEQHPFRERLWELLMLALYRAGRQADALRAFGDARVALVEELGLEPGPALRELEARILGQDPSLDHHAVGRTPTAPAEGNVRAPITSFVGRDAELARVLDLSNASRLVTVIGPGGAGKTRLAVEAALRMRDDVEHGVWIVELAGCARPPPRSRRRSPPRWTSPAATSAASRRSTSSCGTSAGARSSSCSTTASTSSPRQRSSRRASWAASTISGCWPRAERRWACPVRS